MSSRIWKSLSLWLLPWGLYLPVATLHISRILAQENHPGCWCTITISCLVMDVLLERFVFFVPKDPHLVWLTRGPTLKETILIVCNGHRGELITWVICDSAIKGHFVVGVWYNFGAFPLLVCCSSLFVVHFEVVLRIVWLSKRVMYLDEKWHAYCIYPCYGLTRDKKKWNCNDSWQPLSTDSIHYKMALFDALETRPRSSHGKLLCNLGLIVGVSML